MQASLITRILLTGQLLSRHRSFSLDRPLLSGIARKVRKLTLPLVVTRPFRGPATLGTLRPVRLGMYYVRKVSVTATHITSAFPSDFDLKC